MILIDEHLGTLKRDSVECLKREAQSHSGIFRQVGALRNGRAYKKIVSTNSPNLSKSISTETLSKEFLLIVLDIHDFESRYKTLSGTFLHIQPINIPI